MPGSVELVVAAVVVADEEAVTVARGRARSPPSGGSSSRCVEEAHPATPSASGGGEDRDQFSTRGHEGYCRRRPPAPSRRREATRSADAGGPPRVGMRQVLERVVEGRQRLLGTDRGGDQPVGEPGVLGQQRPVQVGADDVARPDALVAVAPVVAMALEDPAQRRRSRAQTGPAAVVLKARENPRAARARAPPRWPRCRSVDLRAPGRGPSRGPPDRRPAASRRRAGRSGRAADSRRTPRG